MADSARAEAFFAAAVRRAGIDALDWVYRFAQDVDPKSPEFGGIRNLYNPMRREFRRSGHGLCLTWSACLAGFAGLAAYDLTGDPLYLDRVKLIAGYVKSNQNLDASDKLRYGTFVVSRDRRFVDVPDASWAGNLFVHLYRRTGEQDYLDRAKLAADWLVDQARMAHGGFTTFYLLDKEQPVAYSHGSDGQHGIFLANLHAETRDARYSEPLKPLADMLSGPGQHESGAYYASLRADGTPVFEGWDEKEGHPLVDGIEKIVTGPRQNYYAARFLVEQYGRGGNQRYLDSALRCSQWSLDHFRRDGYFSDWLTFTDGRWESDGTADVASPGAMTRVWLALNEVAPDPRWIDACREVSEWSLRWQRRQPQDADLHGAIVAQPFLVAYFISFAAWGLLELAQHLQQQAAGS
jgi:uncharacterized protein YyaL (SSP411 family)